jgi:O-antigen/teichoic acid export membrane protein
MAVAYLVVGNTLISLWMGPKYAGACYGILVILTCAATVNISQFTSTQILQGIARHGYTAYVTIFEAAANLALSIILVRKYGIIGVAVGTLVPMLCTNLVIIPWYACRATGLSMRRFFKQGVLVPCIPACFFGVLLYAASSMIAIDRWMEFVTVLTVCLACYVLAAWHLCLSRQERIKRWKDFAVVVRSASAVMRSLVLSIHSRADKSVS